MGGIFTEYLLGKGWTAPCISMLQGVVDQRARSNAVGMFMFVTTVIGSISSVVISPIIQK